MSDSCQHTNPLKHPGTTRVNRFLEMLNPEKVELHSLEIKDWLHFAYDYAESVNYYALQDKDNPQGNWQSFFKSENEISALLEKDGLGTTPPHLTLFLCFLKLLIFPQREINQIPKRHLDFYYKEILRLKKKSFEPDRAHIIFELAQKAQQELVEKNTPLLDGKDKKGKALHYKTSNSLVINRAQVGALQATFVEGTGIAQKLRKAPVVNSPGGTKKPFEKGEFWSAFGNEDWQETESGFYVASPLLKMKEGNRKIILNFSLHAGSFNISKSNIHAELTGEKGWIPANLNLAESHNNSSPKWVFELKKDQKEITVYNEEVHQSLLDTNQPVLRVFFKNISYGSLKNIVLKKLNLKVEVNGIQTLKLEGPMGAINPEQPFMPFGPQPKKGSKFSISYPEMNGKRILQTDLNFIWLGLPEDFSSHYSGYTTTPKNFQIQVISSYQNKSKLENLFAYNASNLSNSNQIKIKDKNESPVTKGKIELQLRDSFLQEEYAGHYVEAILEAQKSEKPQVTLPNKPYVPLLSELTLSYTTEEEVSLGKKSTEKSTLFQMHPFGVKRVTGVKKLLPDYHYSDLFIGLKDMQPGQNVSLLFQVAEGTEDPLHSDFSESGEEIKWFFLSDNDWKPLDEFMIRNNTHHFLQSGIVELTLPETATDDNSLMEPGLHWIRVRMNKIPGAVSKFIGVHTQAIEAVFDNRDNDTTYLEKDLPAESIAKMVFPRAKIQKITQPYASFGGKPDEKDEDFYGRISERLRHKNRSVSIWDYEHLVLENFPELYKVKCLNHTFYCSTGKSLKEMAPGKVTLVLIPKITEKNTRAQRIHPRVSRNLRNRVIQFLDQKRSLHAEIQAVNPFYEEVGFDFKIRFQEGLDFEYFKKQTQKDLIKMLAPWVFDLETDIRFGATVNEYEVVNYLENLTYVDFIEDFRMKKEGESVSEAIPSNPGAILVPAENMTIEKADKCKA